MTNHARLVLVASLLGLMFGLLRNQDGLSLVSLSVLVWLFASWLYLQYQIARVWPKLTCERVINHRTQTQALLWSDRVVDIEVLIRSAKHKLPSITVVHDLVPDLLRLRSGSFWASTAVQSDNIKLAYQVKTLAAGHLQFHGVHFLFQDPQGLFVIERVLAEKTRARILPSSAALGDIRPTIKRTNSLPQHGIHPLKRAGFGSELLELREYQQGDPPKSIAWKVSARRDKLMTRQYESEVPIRMTMLIADSAAMRRGTPGERMLDQVFFVAAGVAKASVHVGDAIGVVVLNGERGGPLRLQPANGDRALYRVLESLADASSNPPAATVPLTRGEVELAIQVCRERFPECMVQSINSPPFSRFSITPSTRKFLRGLDQLAAFLADRNGLDTARTIQLSYDTQLLAPYLRQFLLEQGVRYSPTTKDLDVQAVPNTNATFTLLRDEIGRSLAYARDNEVYVVFANLVTRQESDCIRRVTRISAALKLAVAKHHRVIVVCPMPRQVMQPASIPNGVIDPIPLAIQQAENLQMAESAEYVRRTLASCGVTFAWASDRNVVSRVMAEAELAGNSRKNSAGAR